MKAVRFFGICDLRMENIPKPSPGQDEFLLKIASVGVCGSDVHFYNEGSTGSLKLHHPLILGHEFSAWIESGSQKGQLVTVDPAIPCGRCEFCLEGNPNFCINLQFAGAEETDGALQEYLAWPKNAVFPLPENISPQEGALFEPLGVAIHALRLGNVHPGMNVGVFGAGPIGLLTIQMARASGAASIFATDKLIHRLETAHICGATEPLLANGNETSKILSATGGRGLDVTFEAAGDDGSAVETAIQTTKRGGTTVLIGIPSEDETRFTASTARRKGLTIKLARRMKNTYPTAIRLVKSGKVDLKSLITANYSFEDYTQAYETAANREGVKVIINISS